MGWRVWVYGLTVIGLELYCCNSLLTLTEEASLGPCCQSPSTLSHEPTFPSCRGELETPDPHSFDTIWIWSCLLSINRLISLCFSISSSRKENDYQSYKTMLLSRVLCSFAEVLERDLQLAWCTLPLNVTMSLTKEDKRVWFGRKCLLCCLTLWPINVPGAQLQRWITHTFSFNLQAVEGKRAEEIQFQALVVPDRTWRVCLNNKICDLSRININLIPISMYK